MRGGRATRRLGRRRGPGVPRPSGLQRGDPRPHPRRDAPGDDPGPPGRPGRRTTSTTAADRSFPIADLRPFIDLHERVAGLVAPSKVVAVAVNTSLSPTTARRGGHRRDRRRDGPSRRRPGPVRGGAPLGGDEAGGERPALGRGARGSGAMKPGWDLRPRVLRIPYRDPFRIARDSHGAGAAMSTLIVELRSELLPGLVGLGEGYPDAYYGETLATLPVVMDLPPRGGRAGRPRRVVAGGGRRVADGDRRGVRRRDPRARGGQVRPRHRPPRPGRQGDRDAGPSAARAVGRHPADRLHARPRRAGGRRRARPAGGTLPGPQDQGRRAGRPRHPRGGAGGLRRDRCASTPTPAGRRRRRPSLLPDLVRPRRRADRAAVPAAPATTGSSTSRRRRRCRSSPTRAPSSSRTSRRSSASSTGST